jgi:hypothetical protein
MSFVKRKNGVTSVNIVQHRRINMYEMPKCFIILHKIVLQTLICQLLGRMCRKYFFLGPAKKRVVDFLCAGNI